MWVLFWGMGAFSEKLKSTMQTPVVVLVRRLLRVPSHCEEAAAMPELPESEAFRLAEQSRRANTEGLKPRVS